MAHNFLKTLAVVFTVLLFAGCNTLRDVKVDSYIQDKERVDQQIVEQSAGNWENAPTLEDTNRKKTRKVFVVEFTKDDARYTQDDMIKVLEANPPVKTETVVIEPPANPKETVIRKTQPEIKIPPLDQVKLPPEKQKAPDTTKYVEYKVLKDDTLQKISKKFYDSYSKWRKIYDANKEKIGDPNQIAPGMTIRIPVE